MCMYLHVILLRATTDARVWRAVQASILLVDIAMLGGFARAFNATGRLDLRLWRAEDWTNIGITGGVGLIRAAFLLGIGQKKKLT